MKSFVLKLIAVVGLLIIIDYSVGLVCSALLRSWPDDGSPLSIDNNCFNQVEPELLLMGASQVQHDYNSEIFANILGLDTYNAGQNGIDVIQNYMYFKAICDRKMPRIVVFDIYPAYLDGSMKYRLRNINMWYRLAPPVTTYFDNNANWKEKMKLQSGLMVYNGFPAHIVRAFLRKENVINGFVPLYGSYKGGMAEENSFVVEGDELEYLNKIVAVCKDNDIHLYFTQAPNYIPNNQYKKWLCDYCKENNIQLISHVDDTVFLNKPELFVDNSHLNAEGANVFSEKLASEIRNIEKR